MCQFSVKFKRKTDLFGRNQGETPLEPFCVPPGAGGRFAKVLILLCFGCSCPFRPFKNTKIAKAASRKHLNRRSRFTKVLVLSKRIWACNENPRERTLPGREGQKRPKRTKMNRRWFENGLVGKHLNRRGSFRKVLILPEQIQESTCFVDSDVGFD